MRDSKKGFNHIRSQIDDANLCFFINTIKEVHSQQTTCKVLRISKSTYYAKLNSKITKTIAKRDEILARIKIIHSESKGTYGAPKIHAILSKEGIVCSLKLIQKIMKENGIRSIIIKKYKPQSTKGNTVAEAANLLEQDFSTTTINEKLSGDITYIYTSDNGWCYLASILDLHNNEIIGWEFLKTMTTDIDLGALSKASKKRGRKLSGAIIHTDQGSQYTSAAYTKKITELGCKLSYSRKGNPYDNACIESFHSVLKKELIYLSKPRTFEETYKDLFKYIEGWYNSRRIQKKLGYESPYDFFKIS